jgi:hypothetical protein
MDTASGTDPRPTTIDFPGGGRAVVVFAGPRRPVESLLAAIGLTPPRPVLLVIGGAATLEPLVTERLTRLLERGAVRAAEDAGALVVDGGTASGVMAVVGRAAASSDASVDVLGIAPAGKVTFPGDERAPAPDATQVEPNHTHFILANSGEWGGETALLFEAVEALAGDKPIGVILAGGGEVALDEVRLAARLGAPIIVVTGTGGLADQLAAVATTRRRAGTDEALERIVAAAELTFLPLASDPVDAEAATARVLEPDETLAEAWRQQKLVSAVADRQQRSFRQMQGALLVLGLLLTSLVVAKAVLEGRGLLDAFPGLGTAFYLVILALPIIVTGLATIAGRTRPGGRWILLRGTSEALKREIYRYRARAGIYSRAQTRTRSPQVKLAEAIGSSIGALVRTDVNQLSLGSANRSAAEAAPTGPLSRLTPDDYVAQRIDPQVTWYHRTAARHERTARWLRVLSIAFGGIGTLLAALGLDIYVAVTTALVGVFATTLEAWQLETSVVLYNQAAADLTAIRTWWSALPATERGRQASIDRLVERSERIIRAEHVGWVQEMQDAMTQLRLEQTGDGSAGSRSVTPDAGDEGLDEPVDGEVVDGGAGRQEATEVRRGRFGRR